jgi:hypothetical protein
VTVIATPEVTVMLPGVMTPDTPVNVGVSVVELLEVMVPAPAVRDGGVNSCRTETLRYDIILETALDLPTVGAKPDLDPPPP